MSDIIITIKSGATKKLITKGKMCDGNIIVTAEDTDPVLQEKTATENGTVTPDEGYDGLSKVEVNVPERYDEGVADGKQAEYDAFWDNYQDNGNRTHYEFAFAGRGWSDTTFKPKYDIIATNTGNMFQGCIISDLVKILNDCGVVFDMSQAPQPAGQYLVNACNSLTTLPVLDCRSRANIEYFIISSGQLHTIEKVILKEDGSQKFNNYSFMSLPKLKEIRFEGCIGNSLRIKESSLLSEESVQSIIDCLKDLAGGTAQTLTLHAAVGSKLTDEQKAAITAKNWELVY